MDKNPWEKVKVCIIDDEQDLREIYSVKFMTEDFDVVSAANGKEGLERIRTEKPDIVVLDLLMPIMGGFEVLEQLRTDPVLSKTPVVILSNLDDEDAYKKAGKYGTAFFIVKALATPQKVVDLVKEALAQER